MDSMTRGPLTSGTVVRSLLRTTGLRRSQRGAATAETAAVLPVLAAAVLVFVWMLSLAVTQVRVVDAARETARAAARSDSADDAVAAGRRVAPANARFSVSERGDQVVVTVVSKVAGPAGMFDFLPLPQARATATAALEDR